MEERRRTYFASQLNELHGNQHSNNDEISGLKENGPKLVYSPKCKGIEKEAQDKRSNRDATLVFSIEL